MGPTTLGHESIEVLGPPLPGPGAGELSEAADDALALSDDARAQSSRNVLAPPALEHRFEQCRFGMKRHRRVDEHQRRCPWGFATTPSVPPGIYCHGVAPDATSPDAAALHLLSARWWMGL